MYCKYCGKEIEEDIKFCPYCGKNLQEKQPEEAPAAAVPQTSSTPAQVEEKKPPKVWTVFSRIGRILGIVCFATSFVPFLNYSSLMLGIVGIVFSCLARKAQNEEADKNSRTGLKFSIAAVVVSFVMIILFWVLYAVILGLVLEGAGSYYY